MRAKIFEKDKRCRDRQFKSDKHHFCNRSFWFFDENRALESEGGEKKISGRRGEVWPRAGWCSRPRSTTATSLLRWISREDNARAHVDRQTVSRNKKTPPLRQLLKIWTFFFNLFLFHNLITRCKFRVVAEKTTVKFANYKRQHVVLSKKLPASVCELATFNGDRTDWSSSVVLITNENNQHQCKTYVSWNIKLILLNYSFRVKYRISPGIIQVQVTLLPTPRVTEFDIASQLLESVNYPNSAKQ